MLAQYRCPPLSMLLPVVVSSACDYKFRSLCECRRVYVHVCLNVCQCVSICGLSLFFLYISFYFILFNSFFYIDKSRLQLELVNHCQTYLSCRNPRAIKDRNLTTSSWPKSDMIRQKQAHFTRCRHPLSPNYRACRSLSPLFPHRQVVNHPPCQYPKKGRINRATLKPS